MDEKQTENVRSSSRLKEKYQRRFTLPDRKEELDRLVPDDKTPFKDYNDYKPRKLINNFIKERNTYNNPDKIDLFDEFSGEDFIDDGSSSEDDSDTETSSVSQCKGGAKPKASSDSSTDDEFGASAGKPVSQKRSTRRSLSSRLRRGRDDQSDSEEELAKPLKMHKQRLLAGHSSGSEMSSGDDLSEPLQRKKRRGRPSIQSDGDEDDEIQPAASVPDLVRVDEGSEQSKTPMSKEDKDPDLKEDDETPTEDDAEQPDSGNERDSSSSFIATSSSSDSSESDWSYYKGTSPNKPSHEELICNYRQEKRPRKQSRVAKKRRVLTPSESDSSSEEPDTNVMEQQRPASKRAERLLKKKTAWKEEVLGKYKDKREKKLAHERQEKNTK